MVSLYELIYGVLRGLGMVTGPSNEERLQQLEEKMEETEKKDRKQDLDILRVKARAERLEITVNALKAQVEAGTGYQGGGHATGNQINLGNT